MADEKLITEVNKIHRRYVRRQFWRENLLNGAIPLLYGAMFAMLGSLLGDAIERHDWGHTVIGGLAVIALAVLWWTTVVRRWR